MSQDSRRAFPLSRRTVLRGLGGAAIALPWLEAFTPRGASAQAQQPPKRFIVMFSANGTLPSRWIPTGGETDFSLSPILSPLAPYRDDLVIVQGVDQQGAGGDAHQIGIGGMLTGAPLNSGAFAGVGAPPAGWASGPSVDQRIAEALGNDTSLRSLELGVQVGEADNWGRMVYRASNQPLPPEDEPAAVYDRVFADLHTDPAELARVRRRRASILDSVSAEYTRLGGRLGGADRARLEAHLSAIRELEIRLTGPALAQRAECRDPALTPAPAFANDSYPTIGAQQIDLLVMALACDITRVASLQWSRSVSQTRFTWLGINEGHHDLSHLGDDDPVALDKLEKINQWYASQFAYLIGQLKAFPEGDGTMLDNSLLIWCNELAKGNIHGHADAPYVLAGRAGGGLRTGRFLSFAGGATVPHNNLLVSLLNAMGMPDTTFGKPEWCQGPLSGLV
jgi:hypothetical protein